MKVMDLFRPRVTLLAAFVVTVLLRGMEAAVTAGGVTAAVIFVILQICHLHEFGVDNKESAPLPKQESAKESNQESLYDDVDAQLARHLKTPKASPRGESLEHFLMEQEGGNLPPTASSARDTATDLYTSSAQMRSKLLFLSQQMKYVNTSRNSNAQPLMPQAQELLAQACKQLQSKEAEINCAGSKVKELEEQNSRLQHANVQLGNYLHQMVDGSDGVTDGQKKSGASDSNYFMFGLFD
ncbi:hypothetical protein CYMTET_51723 [Cymbomonas tetramitiformis]|uniref:Uncharacterized protein n=1 Tax=Cymbomonas tetramitiformis TaxID=36881 RepID=A0AAE0BM50_9CHLO|nr:hypothetical protein CYMTET_51723 [Cymbomonas tetramitiformis]